MSNIEKIKAAIPFEVDFTAMEIAMKVFPEMVKSDSEGRVFNRNAGFVARILNRMEGVLKLEKAYWATW